MGSEREGKEKVDELISVEQFIRADGKVVNVAKTFLITLNLPLSGFFACLNAYPAGSSTLLFSLFFSAARRGTKKAANLLRSTR